MKMLSQCIPQITHGPEGCQHGQSAQTKIASHTGQRGRLRTNERAFEGVVHLARLLAELYKSRCFCRTGKARNRVARASGIGEQIHALVLAPGVTCEYRQGSEFEFVFEPGTRIRVDLLENPAHGEDGRAAVDGRAIDHQLSHLATGLVCGFDERDLHVALRELQGCNQPGDACAHHHDAVLMAQTSQMIVLSIDPAARAAGIGQT